MSVLCLVMHVLCVYALKLLSGFFCFFGDFFVWFCFFGDRSGFFGEYWLATALACSTNRFSF